MIVLLLLLFNWYLLFSVFDFIFGYMGTPSYHEEMLCAVVSFGIVVALALLFTLNAGQWLLRITSGARTAIDKEKRQLNPVINHVQNTIKENLKIPPIDLHVMVIDDPIPNALAIGKNTLIVSRGLYETANEEELCGVIAHELGHLHHGDSQKLAVAWGVSVISLSIAFLANLLMIVTGAVNKMGPKGDAGLLINLFAFAFNLFGLFLMMFVWIGNGVFKLAMLYQGRKQEHLADEFAVKSGFGGGLLSFLDKIKDLHWEGQRGLISMMYATHPPVMNRIGNVEKAIEQLG